MKLVPTEPFDIDASIWTVTRGPNGKRICNLTGCGEPHRCKGLCERHFKRWDRWGDPLRVDPRYLRRAEARPKPKGPPKRVGRPPKPKTPKPRRDALAWLDLDRLAATVPADDWATQAACRGRVPAEAFYPEGSTVPKLAYATCETCPVRYECLSVALRDDHGIWGGTSGKQRRRIRVLLRGVA